MYLVYYALTGKDIQVATKFEGKKKLVGKISY